MSGLLLGGFFPPYDFFGPGLDLDAGVLFLELLHPAFGIQELLLAGKEGMAGGADVHPDVLLIGGDLIMRPAGAGGRGLKVFGMDSFFHISFEF